MKRRDAWMPLALLGLMALLSACAGGAGEITTRTVIPDTPEYSVEFQATLADQIIEEIKQRPFPCDRTDPAPECSAMLRSILDYETVVRKLDAAE